MKTHDKRRDSHTRNDHGDVPKPANETHASPEVRVEWDGVGITYMRVRIERDSPRRREFLGHCAEPMN